MQNLKKILKVHPEIGQLSLRLINPLRNGLEDVIVASRVTSKTIFVEERKTSEEPVRMIPKEIACVYKISSHKNFQEDSLNGKEKVYPPKKISLIVPKRREKKCVSLIVPVHNELQYTQQFIYYLYKFTPLDFI